MRRGDVAEGSSHSSSGMCQLRSARRSSGPARERGASARAAVQSDGAASRHRYGHGKPRKRSARATEGRESVVHWVSRSQLIRSTGRPANHGFAVRGSYDIRWMLRSVKTAVRSPRWHQTTA